MKSLSGALFLSMGDEEIGVGEIGRAGRVLHLPHWQFFSRWSLFKGFVLFSVFYAPRENKNDTVWLLLHFLWENKIVSNIWKKYNLWKFNKRGLKAKRIVPNLRNFFQIFWKLVGSCFLGWRTCVPLSILGYVRHLQKDQIDGQDRDKIKNCKNFREKFSKKTTIDILS